MNPHELQSIPAKLEALTDAELASLVIEFAEPDQVALLLSEEIFRRLTELRIKGIASHFLYQEATLTN